MIRINLLPFRAARKKENIRRQLSVFFLSVALVLIVAFWVGYWLSSKVENLNNEIKTTQAQVDKYNKINKEIAEIKKKLDLLNKKIEVIKSLDLTRKAPVQLLDDLARLNIEKRMWLTDLSEKNGSIKVVGVALDNPTIAEYMTRLEKSQRYMNIKLQSISQDDSVKGVNLKAFSISFTKKQPTTNKSKQGPKK